eukprot:22265-Eustigmatos_ZCMA.PRE.1
MRMTLTVDDVPVVLNGWFFLILWLSSFVWCGGGDGGDGGGAPWLLHVWPLSALLSRNMPVYVTHLCPHHSQQDLLERHISHCLWRHARLTQDRERQCREL